MATQLVISESFINEDKGYRYGDTDWYEPYTTDLGRLFRNLRSEYGRCTGHVYIDTADKTVPVGWVFQKRVEYDDANRIRRPEDRTHLRTVWVSAGKRCARHPDAGVTAFDVTTKR